MKKSAKRWKRDNPHPQVLLIWWVHRWLTKLNVRQENERIKAIVQSLAYDQIQEVQKPTIININPLTEGQS